MEFFQLIKNCTFFSSHIISPKEQLLILYIYEIINICVYYVYLFTISSS